MCFNCEDKFTPGNKCKKLFSIEVIWSEEEGMEEAMKPVEDKELVEEDGVQELIC